MIKIKLSDHLKKRLKLQEGIISDEEFEEEAPEKKPIPLKSEKLKNDSKVCTIS